MDLIEHLDALRALRDTGTTGHAAARLRLTQSAVSKRIAALEAEVGAALTERVGRKLQLTPEGERVLAEAEPLLVQLREVLAARSTDRGTLSLAASESLLCAGLPGVLWAASAKVPGLQLQLHAHRGPVAVEQVRAGACALAIVAGAPLAADLVVRPLGEERLVLVGEPPPEGTAPYPVWTVETRSLTWPSIERALRRAAPRIQVEGRLESSAALVQIARAGFARALVPEGVARAFGADRVVLPGVVRPIVLVARPAALARPAVRAFTAALTTEFAGEGVRAAED